MIAPALRTARALDRAGDVLLPLLARAVFAASLAGYFWASALTKLGDGPLGLPPSLGAYAQIFPRVFEAAGYDAARLTWLHDLVVIAGTAAEFVLPALILLGLATRLAALGMAGFVAVQTWVDLVGHGALGDPAALGAWFDRVPDAAIMDQRAFWALLLAVLVTKGAGPLSLDRWLAPRLARRAGLSADRA